ncbi:MAG: hypothetical protein [Bacteriophage sp.]|jgi:hypothetical protein|uniref:hypothetical protein n=1 Tax=Leyella stercorea TaxID=363265 RepID=UPI0022009359|nr:hypothetical protein [Leyella stercorea]UWH91919.1 MAG: hypothetical protein [Bacteriophage sp.]
MDKDLKKLKILMNAINEVEEENQEEEFDEASDFYAELKEAAWNILHENPGTDFGDWQMMLIEQYPTEVVDALGTNPPEVFAELSDWWDCMDYDDGVLEIPHTFREWAEYFATERSVELYDLLVEAKRK